MSVFIFLATVEVYADLVDGNISAYLLNPHLMVEVYADLVDGNTFCLGGMPNG